jgi:YCII-related domain
MPTYLFTYRAPKDYTGSAAAHDAWSAWYQRLGANLRDRGNPCFKAGTVGACDSETTSLGGYSLIRARDLQQAIALAEGCPAVQDAGGVEVGEVTNLDDQFDAWLAAHPAP